jgi:hypothetical protein
MRICGRLGIGVRPSFRMPQNRPPQPNRAPPGSNPIRLRNPEGSRPAMFIPADAPWTAAVGDEVIGN